MPTSFGLILSPPWKLKQKKNPKTKKSSKIQGDDSCKPEPDKAGWAQFLEGSTKQPYASGRNKKDRDLYGLSRARAGERQLRSKTRASASGSSHTRLSPGAPRYRHVSICVAKSRPEPRPFPGLAQAKGQGWEEELRHYISGLSNPQHTSFEIGSGERLQDGRYVFHARLNEHAFGDYETLDNPETGEDHRGES